MTAGVFDNLSALTGLQVNNVEGPLPSDLFEDLTNLNVLKLDASSSSPNLLSAGLFDPLSSLESLNVDNVSILPPGIFDRLARLNFLSLCDGTTGNFPDGLFRRLAALRTLEMCGLDDFRSLRAGTFDGLSGLQDLLIYSNASFQSLPAGIFDDLRALRNLWLLNNQLRTLADNVFQHLASIETIDLGWNPGTEMFVPEAEAGWNQNVSAGAPVKLRGSTSGPWGSNVTVAWTQTEGPTVTLRDANTLTPSFTAPGTDAFDEALEFTLSVIAVNCGPGDADYNCYTDEPATLTATDTVEVTRSPVPAIAFRGASVYDGVPEDTTAILEFSEAAGTVVLTAFMDAPQAETVTVPWETVDYTAVSPGDFAAAQGTLSFAPGETEKTISLSIVDDADEEARIGDSWESFQVSLHGGSAYRLPHGGGVGIALIDNDGANRGGGSGGGSSGGGGDAGNNPVPPETPPVSTPTDPEAPPSVTLSLDPDTIGENGGTSRIAATLSRALSEPIEVSIAAEPLDPAVAADFMLTGTTLTFPAGDTTSTGAVTVTAVDNDVHAPDKQVRISGAVTGEGVTPPEPVILTIEEDDEPPTALTLSLEPATVSEGAGPTEVTVTATFADGARSESTALDIALSAPEGVAAAVAGEDFAEVPGFTLTVPPGQSSGTATFTFEPLQDAVHEGPEAVNVEASSADLELDTGEPPALTIGDDDEPPTAVTLSVEPPTVSEDAGPTEVTVTARFADGLRSAPTPLSVAVAAPQGPGAATARADYTDVAPVTLTIPSAASAGTATFILQPLQDRIHEGPETLLLEAAAEDPALRLDPIEPPELTLNDDDPPPEPVITVDTEAIPEGVGSAEVTVTTGEGSTFPVPTTVELEWSGTASRGEDYNVDAVTLTLPAGVGLEPTRVTVTITAPDDALDEPDETVMLVASIGGAPAGEPVAVTVIDDDTAGIELDSDELVLEEGGAGEYTVVLTSQPFGEATIDLAASTGGVLEIEPARLAFDASNWDRPRTVRVSALRDDDPYDAAVQLDHRATGGGYDGLAASIGVSVADRYVTLPRLSVADATASETDGRIAFELSLNRPAYVDVQLRYATADGTAKAGEDYEAASGTATIAEGELTARVEVPLLADVFAEATEHFTLHISGVRNAELPDAGARGEIRDEPALASEWLARFGRLSGSRVMEAIEQQVFAPRDRASAVTLAGRRVTGGAPAGVLAGLDGPHGPDGAGTSFGGLSAGSLGSAANAPAHFSAPGFGGFGYPGERPWAGAGAFGGNAVPGHFSGAAAPLASTTVSGLDLLANSAFLLNAGPGAANGISVWGQGDYTRFDHLGEGLQTSGDAASVTVGADFACQRCLLGIALSHTSAEAGFGAGADRGGQLESTLTGLYPYFGYRLTERVSTWGLAGQGRGELVASPAPDAPARRTDIENDLAGFGVRGELLSGRAGRAGFALALNADALSSRTRSERAEDILEAEGDYRRLRLGLEGSWTRSLGENGSLRSSLELAARDDAGDAENGLGVELSGALDVLGLAPGLSLNLGVRGLLSHEVESYEEWGVTGGLRYDPDAGSEAGPRVSLIHSWGTAGAGAGGQSRRALLRDGPARALASAPAPRAQRLDASFAWGFETGAGAAIPWLRVGSGGHSGRDYRLGLTAATARGAPTVEFGESARGRDLRLGWAFTLRCRVRMNVELMRTAGRLGGLDDNGFRIGFGSLAGGGCAAPAAFSPSPGRGIGLQ